MKPSIVLTLAMLNRLPFGPSPSEPTDVAVGAYNDTVGSLERSVLPQARRFRDLRVSDATLDEVPALADDTRLLTAPELVESAQRERPITLADPHEAAPTLDKELRRAAGLD